MPALTERQKAQRRRRRYEKRLVESMERGERTGRLTKGRTTLHELGHLWFLWKLIECIDTFIKITIVKDAEANEGAVHYSETPSYTRRQLKAKLRMLIITIKQITIVKDANGNEGLVQYTEAASYTRSHLKAKLLMCIVGKAAEEIGTILLFFNKLSLTMPALTEQQKAQQRRRRYVKRLVESMERGERRHAPRSTSSDICGSCGS
ncbi:hypothetical protein niasHS_001656 [Heterodera schachtii]|uniref:Uncharacterized protein n=1 Tax=Heterodera schachtii TaxID=97005 RepID=A0ABD2KBN5_HETSC